MRVLGLFDQLTRRRHVVESLWPSACQPFEHAEPPRDHQPGSLVSACNRRLAQRFEDVARPLELAELHKQSTELVARAVEVLEYESMTFLDLHPPLEEAGGDVGGVRLDEASPGDRHGKQDGIIDPFGPSQRLPGVDEGRPSISQPQVDPCPLGQNPHRPSVVTLSFCEGLVELLDDRERITRAEPAPPPTDAAHRQLAQDVAPLQPR